MAGTVRKRTWTTRNGAPKIAFVADYFDQNRKRHKRQFAREKAAKDWLHTVVGEVKAGIHTPDADSITVAEAGRLWIDHCEAEEYEAGTLRAYRQYVEIIAPPPVGSAKRQTRSPQTKSLPRLSVTLGSVKLSRLTPPVIEEFRNTLVKAMPRRRARHVLSALRCLLNHAQRLGLVGQNAALPVHIKGNARDDRPIEVGVDVPAKAEIRALLQHAAGRGRPRLVVLMFTGLRTSELRALYWSDIDFDKRVLQVRRRADHPTGTIGRPKSKNGYRDIPMTPTVINTLKEWRLACPPAKPGARDFVFPGALGRPLNHGTIEKSFHAVQRSAGLVDAVGEPKYGLHALRHFFASWGIEQGFSPKRLQMLLGHGSIRMTFDVYGHLFPTPEDDHARLAAADAALLGVRPV